MKRGIILIILISVIISSCSVRRISKEDNETEADQDIIPITTTAKDPETTDVTTYENEKTVPIGIYDMTYCDFGTKEEYELQTNFTDDGTLGRDICVFAAFPSTEKVLSGQNFLYIWQDAVAKNPYALDMKIGYRFAYDTPDGKYDKIILRPAHITKELWDFVEVYIYDDVNQEVTAFYSHLIDDQIKDETLVTSFKITAGERITEVTNIRLTAFMYDPKKADSIDREYAEEHGYTVNVNLYPGRAK